MKISIITTCYNRESTIGGAIRSVLDQDYPDIEYIIVDGASRDRSVERIQEAIKDAPEGMVKFISEPDHGMYEAINKGIRLATGDVVALCHSDDVLYDSHVVSDYMKAFEHTGADLIYSDGLFVEQDDLKKAVRIWYGGNYNHWKVYNGWLPLHPTCYILRSTIERLGLYDESFKISADSDFLVRYLLDKSIKVHYLKGRFSIRMRMGGLSTDSSKRKKMWNEDVLVYKKHGYLFPRFTKLEKMAWKVPQFVLANITSC